MSSQGYCKLNVKIPNYVVDWFANDIDKKKQNEIKLYGEKLCNQEAYMDIVKCLYQGEKQYEELLCSKWLNDSVNELVGENAVIYDVFGLVNTDQKNNKHRRNEWHRDQLCLGGIRASVLYFIPLVDFVENLGPTQVVPGSHLNKDIPSEEECEKLSKKIYAKKGEVFAVDASLVHKAGINTTKNKRPLLLIRYQLPFLKRHIDLCNVYKNLKLNNLLKQRFGFNYSEFTGVLDSLENTNKKNPKEQYKVKYND